MTPEQSTLLQQARESLEQAQQAFATSDYQIATQHAYTAMLDVADAFLRGQRLSVFSDTHIIQKFAQHFTQFRRLSPEFHTYLLAAQAESYFTAPDAQNHINHAQQFIVLAEEKLDHLSTRGYCEC